MFRLAIFFILISCFSCRKKSDLLDNHPPETKLSLDEINLSGTDRLNSIVSLSWYGTDKDGYVKGFEISTDTTEWEFVEQRDSVFQFSISAGSDTNDVSFYVRAIDDKNARDASPAFLRIPLRNSPPTASIDNGMLPGDTVQSVVSLSWSISDLDGAQSIDSVLIRINNGPWVPVNSNARFLSLVPQNPGVAGAGQAVIYYGSSDPQAATIPGLEVNGWNTIYIKAVDIAGSSSMPDSTHPIFVSRQTSDLLIIGANNLQPHAFYTSMANAVYAQGSDFLNYASQGGANHPKYWNPTFNILLSLYDKVILFTDDLTYLNAQSNQNRLVLESASSALQEYLDNGGKAIVSTKFPSTFTNTSAIIGTFPVDSISTSSGQAYLSTDSLVTSPLSYPTLKPSEFILGADPFYPSADAEVTYNAGLVPSGGWSGPRVVGARRKLSGNVNLHFFSIELHKLNGDPVAMQSFFNQVLNNDFNW